MDCCLLTIRTDDAATRVVTEESSGRTGALGAVMSVLGDVARHCLQGARRYGVRHCQAE